MPAALLLAVLMAPLAAVPVADDEPGLPDAAFTAFGRDCTTRFFAGEIELLWDEFARRGKDAFGSSVRLAAYRTSVDEQMGSELELYSEEVLRQDGYRHYRRVARFDKTEQLVEVLWSLGEDLSVVGLRITPSPYEATSPYLDYETRAPLRLPFEGEWFVFWGGRTVNQNYHAQTMDQRFAYDIVVTQDGKSHAGEGTSNADYYAFGKELFAPADGRVVAALDGIPDNVPGVMNAWQALGNHVVLDHGNDEFTFMAHIKQGSVAVQTGDVVKAGDPLGQCGNSGNSSEPHLHIHLQDTPEFLVGKGKPLPFQNYVADGEAVERGEPLKGMVIAPR